ncbi:hypothetical protein, partial [Aeromonas salmonicida]|uniref:hypothetical protein n=1 Tax=Aeromonas salmonicida TaxID=645 RepID=UPI003D315FC1
WRVSSKEGGSIGQNLSGGGPFYTPYAAGDPPAVQLSAGVGAIKKKKKNKTAWGSKEAKEEKKRQQQNAGNRRRGTQENRRKDRRERHKKPHKK